MRDGERAPGERLNEFSISERLGVSRFPVREAFRRLEAEGLVESLPRRGVRVVELNQHDLEVVREMRVALELIAVTTPWLLLGVIARRARQPTAPRMKSTIS